MSKHNIELRKYGKYELTKDYEKKKKNKINIHRHSENIQSPLLVHYQKQ